MKVFHIPLEFEWDKGNSNKNLAKHRVSDAECEEIFFDHAKRIARDALHSGGEERHVVIGKTKAGRILFVAFTARKQKVRIISARDLN
ncbi:BrnT family toxin, partial [Candidatus Uhrbacteria bacterium]|nr:BrnT family toxin [Candidatus Uhrbacteria bacterium]